MIVKELCEKIEEFAPLSACYDWDNSGLQVGSYNSTVTSVLICLDITEDVIDEAIHSNCNTIISHHPLLFFPIKTLNDDAKCNIIKRIIRSDINVYSSHTSFDLSAVGINSYISKQLGLEDVKALSYTEKNVEIGVIGRIQPINLSELLELSKKVFSCDHLRVTNEPLDKIIKSVAFCSGSSSEFLVDAACKGADAFITADAKMPSYQNALELGVSLINTTHFQSEVCFVSQMTEILSKLFPKTLFIRSEQGDFERIV